MANNGNIALSVGVILLLVNVGVGASGVLDGVIEDTVDETVNDGYDGLDDDGNQDYTADFGDDWVNSSGTKAYFANSVSIWKRSLLVLPPQPMRGLAPSFTMKTKLEKSSNTTILRVRSHIRVTQPSNGAEIAPGKANNPYQEIP